MTTERSRFLVDQERAFLNADDSHFFWQTGGDYFAGTERRLLDGFPLPTGARVLEVGCGEGGNLLNLLRDHPGAPRLVVGIDLFFRKLTFAARHVAGARFVCADATMLPFPDGAFDVVLCRDLLHHLEDREPAVRELARVCRRGGDVWIVEPNGRNPLIGLFALAMPHERGQLQTSVASLEALVRRHFASIEVRTLQPMPIFRALLHYRFGLPSLGRSRLFGRVMDAWQALCGAVLPRRVWAYIIVRTTARE
jgi:ubiquinone/menaquinone biosynthesis C-methylase UbiE